VERRGNGLAGAVRVFVIWDGMGYCRQEGRALTPSEPPKVNIKSLNPKYQTYERVRRK